LKGVLSLGYNENAKEMISTKKILLSIAVLVSVLGLTGCGRFGQGGLTPQGPTSGPTPTTGTGQPTKPASTPASETDIDKELKAIEDELNSVNPKSVNDDFSGLGN